MSNYKINDLPVFTKADFDALSEYLTTNGAPQEIFDDQNISKEEISQYASSLSSCTRRFGQIHRMLGNYKIYLDVVEPCDLKSGTGNTLKPFITAKPALDYCKDEHQNSEFLINGGVYRIEGRDLYVRKNGSKGEQKIDLAPWMMQGNIDTPFNPEVIAYDESGARFFVIGTKADERFLCWYDPRTDSTSYIQTIGGSSEPPPEMELRDKGSELHLYYNDRSIRIDLEKFNYYANTEGWEFFKAPSDNLDTIKAHPGNDNIVYMYGHAGLFVSENGGRTWEKKIKGLVQDIEFDPSNSDTIHAIVSKDRTSFHYISSNGGITWQERHHFNVWPYNNQYPDCIHFDVNDPKIIYFGTTTGIFRLTGKDYQLMPFGHGLTRLRTWDIGQDRSGKLYVVPEISDHPVGPHGRYEAPSLASSDGGKTWEIDRQVDGIDWHVTDFSLDAKAGRLYAQAEGGNLYSTLPGGQWEIEDKAWGFKGPLSFDEKGSLISRAQSCSFYHPIVGGIFSRPSDAGAWQLGGSLGFRSITSISNGPGFTYALERGSRTVGLWRRVR